MLELQPNSLRLVAVWGLVDAAAAVAFGGALGRYVDGCLSRVQAASQMYVLQNAMLVISAVASLLLLWSDVRSGPAFWAALLVMMGAGAASTLGALGSTLSGKATILITAILVMPGSLSPTPPPDRLPTVLPCAVEREWTKTLCGSDSAALAALNAAMRRIDLSCLIASPIMAGLDMQYGSLSAAVLLLLAWNLCSWFPEVLLLRYAQRCSPALAADKPAPAADSSSSSSSSSGGGGICRRIARSLDQQLQSWTLYACQPAAPAAAALALLYLTVLSWGTLMTAYLKTLGLPEADLAVWRGCVSLCKWQREWAGKQQQQGIAEL
jgi:iron-regulated transporter 1